MGAGRRHDSAAAVVAARALHLLQRPYEAALRDAGITRQTVWHQETPNGTLALVYFKADDEAGVAKFGSSDAPFNRWFRDKMQEVHGVDISQPGRPITKVHDVQL